MSLKQVTLEDLELNRKATRLTAKELPSPAHTGFVWNHGDNNTICWFPQGIAGIKAETGKRQNWLAVTWYNKDKDTKCDQDEPNKGVRISMVHVTDMSNVTYRHVLLVDEKEEPLTGVHAGGLVFHNDAFYVPDTHNGRKTIRVFSLGNLYEPTAAEPTAAEPTAAEPTAAEPTAAEPTAAEPTAAEPTAAEPTAAEPTAAEPTAAEPTAAEPTAAEPTAAEPTAAEPTAAEPTAAEPTAAEPTAAEPTAADQSDRFFNYKYILKQSSSFKVGISPSFLSYDWSLDQCLVGTFNEHCPEPLQWYSIEDNQPDLKASSGVWYSQMQGAASDSNFLWVACSYGRNNPSRLHYGPYTPKNEIPVNLDTFSTKEYPPWA